MAAIGDRLDFVLRGASLFGTPRLLLMVILRDGKFLIILTTASAQGSDDGAFV